MFTPAGTRLAGTGYVRDPSTLPECGSYPIDRREISPKAKSGKTAIYALEPVGSLPQHPFEDS